MTDKCEHADESAAPGGKPAVTDSPADVHDHPLPKSMRLGAVAYSLALGLFGGLVLYDLAEDKRNDREQAQAIFAEIDRRTSSRLKNEAAQQKQIDAAEAEAEAQSEATRTAVCALLANDFEPSPTVVSVGKALNCTPPITLATP